MQSVLAAQEAPQVGEFPFSQFVESNPSGQLNNHHQFSVIKSKNGGFLKNKSKILGTVLLIAGLVSVGLIINGITLGAGGAVIIPITVSLVTAGTTTLIQSIFKKDNPDETNRKMFKVWLKFHSAQHREHQTKMMQNLLETKLRKETMQQQALELQREALEVEKQRLAMMKDS